MKPSQNRPPAFNTTGAPLRPPLNKPLKARQPVTTVTETKGYLP